MIRFAYTIYFANLFLTFVYSNAYTSDKIPFQWWMQIVIIIFLWIVFFKASKSHLEIKSNHIFKKENIDMWILGAVLFITLSISITDIISNNIFSVGHHYFRGRISSESWKEMKIGYSLTINKKYSYTITKKDYNTLNIMMYRTFSLFWLLFSYVSIIFIRNTNSDDSRNKEIK